ncbi:MAG TPA: mechanosensitive ion channel domain-containing protein [Steroidobacteraceae bacterium]|jgi:small-conductance mechanosensitive channel|nr:mechanosensitive ion channel domain-containing protein [Steroidobacteraceae bacterium]
MDSAGSALRGVLVQLTSASVLAAGLALLVACLAALAVALVLRARRGGGLATLRPSRAAHGLDHALEGVVIIAPILAALATLLAGDVLLIALGVPTEPIQAATRVVAALAVVRLGVFVLGLLLGPHSWVRSRQQGITLVLWAIVASAILGWLDLIEASLNRVSLVPGRAQFSLWALLKGLVVVSAFVIVASLIARAFERHVMRLDQLAVSTRVGVSKFASFLLVGLGLLLGINAAGVDITTLNVLTGAIGLGLGFGLQSVASNFVSGFVLLMDKSIKPGDVISFSGYDGASTGNFGWVQELRGRYVVVRDRDGVDTLVPNQNLITTAFINWSYSDQRVRLKLPVTVSYDDDPEIALQLLLQATENHPRILRDPPPVSRLISFGDFGMRLEIRFWIADPVNGVNNVRSDVNRAIWRIFRTHGITIPVPQQETRLLPRRAPHAPAPSPLPQAPPAGSDRAAD